MGATAWAIPVGILAAIVVIGILFTWWWFPRAYQHGMKKDADEVNAASGEDREEQRRKNREIIANFKNARARERGEIAYDPASVELEAGHGVEAPPPVYSVRS